MRLKALALALAIGAASSVVAMAQDLTMLASAGGSGRTFEAAARHFTEATGINVRVIQYPYAEMREKQLLELATGTGAIDVVGVDGSAALGELAPFLVPLTVDEAHLAEFMPSMLDIFRSEEGLVALPMRVADWVVIYRKDAFAAAGLEPPRTWTDMLAAAKALTKDGAYGFAPALKQGNYLVAQWIPFLFSAGGELLDENRTSAAFNSPAGVRATRFLADLYLTHKVVPPGSIAYEQTDVIGAIQQGVAMMAFTYAPYFLAMNNAKESTVAGKLAVSPMIPVDEESGLETGKTLISGWGFGISKSSRNPEAAQRFIEYVTSREVQLRLAVENSNAPTVSAVYEDPAYVEVFPAAPDVLKTLASAADRPAIVDWTLVEDVLARELSAAVTGAKSAEDALAAAEAAVNGILN